ncbi:MAG TPA: hypothetical protein VFS53_07245 [Gemmatimonadota bacterium]|nr:hypothetical protein [Gemmatimonadota bacterium]
MRVRWTIGGLLAVAIAWSPAGAQELAPSELRLAWASPPSAEWPAAESRSVAESRSAPVLTLGGLAGGAVGLVGGFYVGAVLASDDDGDDLDVLSGGVAGATIGEGLLVPLGVHIANGGRGSYTTSALASLGIAAAGLLALQAVHYDPPGAPIVLVAVPVAQILTSIAIERATD